MASFACTTSPPSTAFQKSYPEYADWQIDGARLYVAIVAVLDRVRAAWSPEYCAVCLKPENAFKTQQAVYAEIKASEEWAAWYWMGQNETYAMEQYLMRGLAGTAPVPPGSKNEEHETLRYFFSK